MATSRPPRAGALRRLEVSVELTLDASLSATARIILGALILEDPGPVVFPTDRELAERHGVSERTVRSALAAGERAGWIRRATWDELMADFPDLAARVPRVCRPKRFIVLLWLHQGRGPATPVRKPPSVKPAHTGQAQPEVPAPDCRPLACARSASSDFERTREQRTFVSPLSPPEDAATLWPDMPVRTREHLARMMAAAAAREAQPGFVPAPSVWEPPKPAPARTARMRAEEMVAACLGPDAPAALNALLLWLTTELHDSKPLTRACWSREIPRILESADGFDRLVDLIMGAKSKRWPSHWFSKCLARGQPSAQKEPTPGAAYQTSPGAGARSSLPHAAPVSKYTRRVNP